MRIGQGIDIHRFAYGRKLMLGGVLIAHPRGLAGHSDADVLVHAIVDALLGAAALGDIGGMFPSSEPRWQDAPGRELLALAAERVREAGYRIGNIDATVVAQAPRLSPYVASMRAAIAAAARVEEGAVNVKATTADELGFTGRGEGIAALAAVLLE
jgi:2-C-methyl-D-erythritol 2,4-cyclodiphosphate synthase